MKRLSLLFLFSIFSFCLSAETAKLYKNEIGNSVLEMYKNYIQYRRDTTTTFEMIKSRFSPELADYLIDDERSDGYDFLTDGHYEYDQIAKTLSVKVESNYVTVSYTFDNWLGKKVSVSIDLYYNKKGKISHMRIQNGATLIPENVPLDPLTFL